MLSIKKGWLFIVALFPVVSAFAQQASPATQDTVDFMRSNGKIYVVMAVVTTIVLGLFVYLVNLDRKIRKLEKNTKD